MQSTVLAQALRAVVRSNVPRADRAREAAELIREAGGFRWVGVYDVTPVEISAIAWTGDEAPAYPTFPRDQGLNGSAVASGITVVSNDVANDARYLTAFGTTGSEMIVPICNDSFEVVGTIDVESPETSAFGPVQQELVEACAPELLPLWTTQHPS